MKLEEITGISAGIFTAASLIPQLIKTFKEKEAKSLSLGMMFVLIVGNGLWICYGFMKNDLPIVSTNIFSEVINLFLLFFSFRYKKKEA